MHTSEYMAVKDENNGKIYVIATFVWKAFNYRPQTKFAAR